MDMQDKFSLPSFVFLPLHLVALAGLSFDYGDVCLYFRRRRSLLEYQLLLAFLLASFFLGMDLASAYKEYRNQLFYASGRPQTALEASPFEKLALLEMTRRNQKIEERE